MSIPEARSWDLRAAVRAPVPVGKGVRFAEDVKGVRVQMIEDTRGVLEKAGVLKSGGGSEKMILVKR